MLAIAAVSFIALAHADSPAPARAERGASGGAIRSEDVGADRRELGMWWDWAASPPPPLDWFGHVIPPRPTPVLTVKRDFWGHVVPTTASEPNALDDLEQPPPALSFGMGVAACLLILGAVLAIRDCCASCGKPRFVPLPTLDSDETRHLPRWAWAVPACISYVMLAACVLAGLMVPSMYLQIVKHLLLFYLGYALLYASIVLVGVRCVAPSLFPTTASSPPPLSLSPPTAEQPS